MKHAIRVEIAAYSNDDSMDDVLRTSVSVTAHSKLQATAFAKKLDDAVRNIIMEATREECRTQAIARNQAEVKPQ